MEAKSKQGIISSIELKRPGSKCLYTAIVLLLVIVCLICAIPILWILFSGFKTPAEMYKIPPSFFPEHIDLSKLSAAWTQMKFYKYYINTFILAIGTTVFTLLFNGLAGYVLSKLKPAGNQLFSTLIFITMLVPGTMSTVPIYMSIIKVPVLGINLSNSYLPLWLMCVGGFNIILFKNFFDGISNSVIESARIDGASTVRVFFNIIVPMSLPVFMTVAIFSFNGSMGTYFWPYLLISDNSKTVLGVQLYKMKSSTFSVDYQMLAIIFSIIPQVIIFALFQKNIVGGISTGAVKG